MKTKKTLLLALILGLIPFYRSFGQSTQQTVKVSNLENVQGTLYIGWYNKPSDFRINDKAIYRAKIDVNGQSELVKQFNDIPEGTYAIAVFLDENDNYELETNFWGIPTEKYGFSNNILPTFRPATFEESAFKLSEKETTVSIKLSNL